MILITQQIMIGKVFEIIILAIFIVNLCYFLGHAWLIICFITREWQNNHLDGKTEEQLLRDNNDNFYDYFGIDDNTDYHNTLLATYYTYTTLSTVGFGDLVPRSDPERLICSGILLVGVAIFSVFLGQFTDIIAAYKSVNEEVDETDQLDLFFGLMKHFNNDQPMDNSLEQKIRTFFLFKWDNDRNQIRHNPEDNKILEQLPEDCQDKVFTTFLFGDFIQNFSSEYFKFFKTENLMGMHIHTHDHCKHPFTWED